MRITIVGVGALGSNLVLALRSLGVDIKIIDHDHVESKNVLTQFHAKSSVGKSKVTALAQTMQFLFHSKIETNPHKLIATNVQQLLAGADLVVDCLDNPESRRVVQSYVREFKMDCIHGALAADGIYGRVVWDDKFTIDEAPAGKPTCEGGEHLPFIMVVSSYLALSIARFVKEGKKNGYEITPMSVMVT